jgi:hypothetical protein
MSVFCTLFGLLWIGASSMAYAQNSNGGIDGMVLDPSQAAVRNALATITQKSTGWTVTLLTNEFGRYSVPDLARGTYSVVIKASGFATGVLKGNYK